jgi:predicted regulator of Ras-like GTPase activity (Roadblock/LC7/MglB family)
MSSDPKMNAGGSDPTGEDDLRTPGLARQIRQSEGLSPASGPAARFDPNLTDLLVSVAASKAIAAVLSKLVEDCRASTGMVLDRAGQIIVSEGKSYQNELMMLGALVAGTYASTREMARILHEENFRMLLQEGAREKIFTQAVGDQWLVSVIFDRKTHLGLVKVLCERATTDLSGTLAMVIEENQNRIRSDDGTLARVAQDTIDLIFRKDDA